MHVATNFFEVTALANPHQAYTASENHTDPENFFIDDTGSAAHLGHEQAILVDARAAIASFGPSDSQMVPIASPVDEIGSVGSVEGAHAADPIGVWPQVQILHRRWKFRRCHKHDNAGAFESLALSLAGSL